MKKNLLLVVTGLALFGGLVSCGENPSSNVSSSSSSSIVQVDPNNRERTLEIFTPTDLTKNPFEVEKSIKLYSRMDGIMKPSATYAIKSGKESVSLEGNVLTGLKEGNAVVSSTVVMGDKTYTADLNIHVNKKHVGIYYKTMNVEEILDEVNSYTEMGRDADNDQNLYTVTGYAYNVAGDKYGNFDLYNDDYSKKIQVYGATFTESALSYTTDSEGNNLTVRFDNPRDSAGWSIRNGDKVTIKAVGQLYSKGKPEIMGVVDKNSIVSTTENKSFNARVEINDESLGKAVLNKTDGLYIGEELTLTCTPKEGQKAFKVEVNGKQIAPTADNANVYKLNADLTTTVKVEFASKDKVAESSYLDVNSLGIKGSSYGSNNGDHKAGEVTYTTSCVACGYNDSTVLQFKKEDEQGSIANKSPIATGISRIEITYKENTHSNTSCWRADFGNDAAVSGEQKAIDTESGTLKYVIEPSNKTYQYFKLTNTSGYTAYVQSIEVFFNI